MSTERHGIVRVRRHKGKNKEIKRERGTRWRLEARASQGGAVTLVVTNSQSPSNAAMALSFNEFE